MTQPAIRRVTARSALGCTTRENIGVTGNEEPAGFQAATVYPPRWYASGPERRRLVDCPGRDSISKLTVYRWVRWI